MSAEEEPSSRLALEETKRLEEEFLKDLAEVFKGKEFEFGDRLRSLLFELWVRARGFNGDVVQELNNLRKLKTERMDLQAQFEIELNYFRAEILDLKSKFKEEILETLRIGQADEEIVKVLSRVCKFESGLEGRVEYPNRFVLKNDLTTEFSESDQIQEKFRERLRHEGLLLPNDVEQKWIPVWFNIQTGEQAAFELRIHQMGYLLQGEEIRRSLSWHNNEWLFPNPQPDSTGDVPVGLTLYVEGVKVDNLESIIWTHKWCTKRSGFVVVSVSGLSTIGTEIVEAQYKVFNRIML